MNNLFEVWRNYSKDQLESLKGPLSSALLSKVEQSLTWQNQALPTGEYWKYLSFGDLKTTKFVEAKTTSKNSQWLHENEVVIQVSDFFEMTNIAFSKLPEGLKIYNHKELLDSEDLISDWSENQNRLPVQENNPFAQMPMSFFGLGIVIVVEKSVHLNEPIKIIFDLNNFENKDSFANFSLQVIMKPQSSAKIYVENNSDQFVGLSNFRYDLFLEESSNLSFYSKESGGLQSRSLQHLFSNVHKDANLKVFDITLPNQWSRHNSTIALKDPNAYTQMKGIYLNNKNNFCDHHTDIQHLKEQTFSSQKYKGILTDQAKAVFNGKVFIEKYAKQSQSEQMNKNLMLSKKAEVDTKPELQIYNDDVKASHGATIGQIDDEQLFYLMSRGYTPRQSWNALAKAFIYDLLDDENDVAVQFLESDIVRTLHNFEGLEDVL